MFSEQLTLELACLPGYDLLAALGKARDLGFQSVAALPGGPRAEHSLGPFPTFAVYGASEDHLQRLREALAPFRRRSVHQAWDDQWREWVRCARCTGAEIITVHAGLRRARETPTQFITRRALELLTMADEASESGIQIGVENEGGPLEDYVDLLDAATHPFLGATIDVGHCAYFDHVLAHRETDERIPALNTAIRDLIRHFGPRVFSFHVHDVRPMDWRDHRSIGSGVVDFAVLLGELRHVGFDGLFEIELEEPDGEAEAVRSAETMARLWGDGS